jgi:hypothetical protein
VFLREAEKRTHYERVLFLISWLSIKITGAVVDSSFVNDKIRREAQEPL